MLAALRNCGGKRVFSECKQNKLQTGQNSHLAVEPAAPAVLCRKKCADYFEYGVKFFFFFFFAPAEIFSALFRCSCQQSH